MRLRPTTPDDLTELYAVFGEAIGDVYERRALTAPNPTFDVFASQQRHLLEHDADRCWVADDGRVAAFVAAFVRDGTWYLASLFVRPENQARGLGRELLERAWAPDAGRRLTITDAIQPASNALYARRGLIPATPLLSFAGAPRIDAPGGLAPAEPDASALRALDLAAYGFDRSRDHALWQRDARATVWRREGRPVAYAYAWPAGSVGPVAGVDAEAAADALRAELARHAGGSAVVRLPGSSAAAVEVALAAGLRLADVPGLLLVSRPHVPPDSLVIGSYTLL